MRSWHWYLDAWYSWHKFCCHLNRAHYHQPDMQRDIKKRHWQVLCLSVACMFIMTRRSIKQISRSPKKFSVPVSAAFWNSHNGLEQAQHRSVSGWNKITDFSAQISHRSVSVARLLSILRISRNAWAWASATGAPGLCTRTAQMAADCRTRYTRSYAHCHSAINPCYTFHHWPTNSKFEIRLLSILYTWTSMTAKRWGNQRAGLQQQKCASTHRRGKFCICLPERQGDSR